MPLQSPKAFLMCGPPCSGKTTIALNLVRLFGADRLSSDDLILREAERLGQTYEETFPHYINQAVQLYQDGVRTATSLSMNVILDRTNVTVKSRRRELDLIPDNYQIIAVAVGLDLHPLELKARRDARVADGGPYIPDNVIENMYVDFQCAPPTVNEGIDMVLRIGKLDNVTTIP